MDNISTAQRFVITDLLDQITYLMGKESMVEDEISRSVMNDSDRDPIRFRHEGGQVTGQESQGGEETPQEG